MELKENGLNSMGIYRVYAISVEERLDNNTKWEISLPKEMVLINAIYIPVEGRGDRLIRRWEIRANQVGRFEIICNLRKLCCGRKIIESRSYSVYVQ